MIIYKKNLPTVRQSIREGGGFRKEKRKFYQECIPERGIFQRKRETGRGVVGSGEEGRWGRGWPTDGDGWRSGALSLQWGEQMLRWMPSVQSEGSERGGRGGGGGRGSQPCLPLGPPCLRRQEPSSVSRAIFTKAWKLLLLSLRLSCEGGWNRQIPSLETQQNHRKRPVHTRTKVTQIITNPFLFFFFFLTMGLC